MKIQIVKKTLVLAIIILFIGMVFTPMISGDLTSFQKVLSNENHKRTFYENIPPIADFTYEPVEITTGELIYFNSTSYDNDGAIINWTWDFGDGNTAYDEFVTNTYWDDGVYTVNLTVMDNASATDSIEKTIVVSNQAPTADFSFTPEYPSTNEEINFNDESADPDGIIVTWWWDFGDGYYSDLQNPKHRYNTIGNYTVSLTVTDDDEEIDVVEKSITVIDQNEAPSAPSITGSDIVKIGEEYSFLFQSVDPDGDNIRYIVTWGDSTEDVSEFYPSNELVMMNHIWDIPTMFMVLRMTVTAEDEYGAKSPLTEKWVIVVAIDINEGSYSIQNHQKIDIGQYTQHTSKQSLQSN